MHYIIIASIIFITFFLLYKNRDRFLSDRKVIISVCLIIIVILSLRFGQVLFALLAALLPILFRSGTFLIRNIGILNLVKYFSRKQASTVSKKQMSKSEAYDILGVKPGSSKEEVMLQYRKLMKQNHPDKGGSKHLSILINKAKDTLIS